MIKINNPLLLPFPWNGGIHRLEERKKKNPERGVNGQPIELRKIGYLPLFLSAKILSPNRNSDSTLFWEKSKNLEERREEGVLYWSWRGKIGIGISIPRLSRFSFFPSNYLEHHLRGRGAAIRIRDQDNPLSYQLSSVLQPYLLNTRCVQGWEKSVHVNGKGIRKKGKKENHWIPVPFFV